MALRIADVQTAGLPWLVVEDDGEVAAIRANAMMYSLVQTAKANGINPFEYLQSELHGGQSRDSFLVGTRVW